MLNNRNKKLPWINNIVGFSIFLYYLAILCSYITEWRFRQEIYYGASALCVLAFFVWKIHDGKICINRRIALFISFCALTGFLNFVFVGNTTIIKLLECAFINTIIACMLVEVRFDRRVLLGVTYLYCAYFAYLFLVYGGGVRLFTRYSNNFVSIIILFPVVMYYAIAEQYRDKISYIPALIVWILSLLASGRSGIGASSILFVSIFLYCELRSEKSKQQSRVLFIFGILWKTILIILIGVVIYYIFVEYSSVILRKFLQSGFDNQARAVIWKDYIDHTFDSLKNIVLGTPKENLIMGRIFEGNAHNSFINIHVDNGILVLIVFGYLVYSIVYAVKNKKWIFLICLVTFCFRAFFDNVFWGTKGTAILMYFMFFPILIKSNVHLSGGVYS